MMVLVLIVNGAKMWKVVALQHLPRKSDRVVVGGRVHEVIYVQHAEGARPLVVFKSVKTKDATLVAEGWHFL